MNINLIVAMCKKTRGIGYKNKLSWHISDDLKQFQKLTIGNKKNAVIMGKYTWDSLPKKPLKKRKNIILSSTLQNNNPPFNQIKKQQVSVFNDIPSAITNLERNDIHELWVVGGGQIYDEFLKRDLISKIYLTNVYDLKMSFDVFFPNIPNQFHKTYCVEIKTEKTLFGPTFKKTKFNYEIYTK